MCNACKLLQCKYEYMKYIDIQSDKCLFYFVNIFIDAILNNINCIYNVKIWVGLGNRLYKIATR